MNLTILNELIDLYEENKEYDQRLLNIEDELTAINSKLSSINDLSNAIKDKFTEFSRFISGKYFFNNSKNIESYNYKPTLNTTYSFFNINVEFRNNIFACSLFICDYIVYFRITNVKHGEILCSINNEIKPFQYEILDPGENKLLNINGIHKQIYSRSMLMLSDKLGLMIKELEYINTNFENEIYKLTREFLKDHWEEGVLKFINN